VTRSLRSYSLLFVALAGALALAVLWFATLGKSEDTPAVTRSALAQTSRAQGAPDRSLILSRVTVDPGATLALHHHLGSQVARIQSGVLRYTVEQGSVTVRRGESDDNPGVVRKIKAGQTGNLRAGDWLVEQPSDIHRAANKTSKPVVIYLATLLKTGAPPATPVSP
jgi:quercetin dioxygenase-like cupin family protein